MLRELLVFDPTKLADKELDGLAKASDTIARLALQPFPQMHDPSA